MSSDIASSAAEPQPGGDTADPTGIAAPYVVTGAIWALVAAVAAALVTLDLALGISLGVAWLGVGRLSAVIRFTALLGAVSLPVAAYLVLSLPTSVGEQTARKWARWGLVTWNVGLLVGVVGILAGFMSPSVWLPAPAPAVALVLLGAGLWSLSLWVTVSNCRPRPPVAAWFGLAAAVGLLVYLSLGLLATSGAHGPGQALAAALSGRGLACVWAITAGMGVAAARFPASARRPLYGRMAVVGGLWSWLFLQALSAPRDLAPELLPAWLVSPTSAASALTALAAVVLAVALFGAFVGSTGADWPRDMPTAFVAVGLAIALVQVVAQAALGPAAARITQFTAWDPATGLLPAFAALTLVAIGASYALFPGRPIGRGTLSMRAHLFLAAGAALLLVLPLWAVGLAEAAVGPGADILRLRAAATAPGALLLLASAIVWVSNISRSARSAPADIRTSDVVAAGPGPSAAAVVGTAATLFVVALFVTLFLPLVDSSYIGVTEQATVRYLEPGRLPEMGRRRYVADGCVACHTQRVRQYPEDVMYGPVTPMGDYTYGPPLAGVRRAGPDLAWVGDRNLSRDQMIESLGVHGPGGAPALPWLVGAGGAVTRDGAPVVDYLLRLRSGVGAAPLAGEQQ